MNSQDDSPAFPVSIEQSHGHPGMSLRDWFAGQALAGIAVQNVALTVVPGVISEDEARADVWQGCAEAAYIAADAMLAARRPR